MNVTIIGATGDIGSLVTQFAVGKGYTVNAFDISAAHSAKLGEAEKKLHSLRRNILDAHLHAAGAAISRRGDNHHPATRPRQTGRSYEDVEFGGVRNIVDVAQQQSVKKIVFISADGVSAESVGDINQAKFKAEEAIRNSGIRYTILQSSGLYKDFELFQIPQVLRLGETDTWPFGPAEYHFSPLSHIDMARCLADAVENPAAENKTIRMGGPDCLTWGELTMIAKKLGINAHYTKGISKEALIEGIRKNPGNRVFSPEQIQDVLFDSVIDFTQIHDIFNMDFQRVEHSGGCFPWLKRL